MVNLQAFKILRRIDAAIHALRGKEVHWNKDGFPYEINRGPRGIFQKQEIPTVFPHWSYKLISWTKIFNEHRST